MRDPNIHRSHFLLDPDASVVIYDAKTWLYVSHFTSWGARTIISGSKGVDLMKNRLYQLIDSSVHNLWFKAETRNLLHFHILKIIIISAIVAHCIAHAVYYVMVTMSLCAVNVICV